MRWLVALLVNLVRLVCWPVRWTISSRAAPRGAWLRISVSGRVAEVAPESRYWDRRPRPLALHELRRLVGMAATDPRVAGLLFVFEGWQGGTATATALRRILLDARDRGKRVVAYLPQGGGTRTTYVASAADQIVLAPQSHLAPVGYSVQSVYLKDALDRVGVEPEVLAHGRFKTAGENLVSNAMSAAQREQLGALLDDFHESLLDALAEGRGVTRTLARQWIDEGPWPASAAIRQGLADAGAYPDELPRKLAPDAPGGARVVPFRRYLRRRVLEWYPWRRPSRIGVIELRGPIVSDAVLGLPVATGARFTECIERALDDRSVRGVVLHVDSPGGSVLVSDLMLHGVRRLAEKKPVVAYFGDVAASGGYLAALGASCIFAEPTTVTGSIGVVAARLGVGPLLDRMGVSIETVKRGARADMHSPMRALTPDERALLERELEEVYRYFVESVARGRGRTPGEIEPLAAGRVYSGRAALQQGLVDGVGGFPEAMAAIRGRIGDAADRCEPRLVGARWSREVLASLWPSRSLSLGGWDAAVALSWAGPRQRVWVWCPSQLVEADSGYCSLLAN